MTNQNIMKKINTVNPIVKANKEARCFRILLRSVFCVDDKKVDGLSFIRFPLFKTSILLHFKHENLNS